MKTSSSSPLLLLRRTPSDSGVNRGLFFSASDVIFVVVVTHTARACPPSQVGAERCSPPPPAFLTVWSPVPPSFSLFPRPLPLLVRTPHQSRTHQRHLTTTWSGTTSPIRGECAVTHIYMYVSSLRDSHSLSQSSKPKQQHPTQQHQTIYAKPCSSRGVDESRGL